MNLDQVAAMRKISVLLASVLFAFGCDASITGDGNGIFDPSNPNDPGNPNDPNDPSNPSNPACDQVVPIEIVPPTPPDLLLVVDKSGSMRDPLDNGAQKWSTMRNALSQITNLYAGGINFGLMLYPTGDFCDVGQVNVGVSGASAGAINDVLIATTPEGGTPTHTTMSGALQYYQSIPANPNGRFVLLATDGEPNCINLNDPNIPAVNESIDAIASLNAQGIATFVLGFGSTINNNPATLTAMAQAGGTTNYYAANSPAELQAALDAIAGEISIPECTFSLTEIPPDDNELSVFFDNTVIPRDPSRTTGWDYDPATNSITLYGVTCDELQSGSVNEVRVDYGCGGGPVID